jgi:Flp pilus assembly protein protease CpaA
MQIVIVLLLLTIFVSIYDHRQGEIPNWITWPLLLAGIYAHAPGTLAIDFSSLLLILFWFFFSEKIGEGDIKLWLALLWALPPSLGDTSSMMIFVVLTVTAGFQILLRRWGGGNRSLGSAEGAAWRTVAFMALLALFYWPQIRNV